MMEYRGTLHKMYTRLDSPVSYSLDLSGQTVVLNDSIGKTLRLKFQSEIICVHCGRITKKSFNQGYCYPCFSTLAQCDVCIMSPEKCHYHLGTCREPEWGQTNCMTNHIVYLSNTTGVKVGITRETQLPTRWIDQGAVQAMPIFRVGKRYHSGIIETAFKAFVADRTNWRNMLKNQLEEVDLGEVFESCWERVKPELSDEILEDLEVLADYDSLVDIEYPALGYPSKINSFNLDKTPEIEGQLQAIKGQYLIFDTGVINIRKYSGYQVILTVDT